MSQPNWKCISQLGDVSPVEYGGFWVFDDKTGVYAPECELLVTPDDENCEYIAYRFSIEQCTYIDGILSDNRFHADHPAWFADDLKSVASFVGQSVASLIVDLCSNDIEERAIAYRAIGDYHGFENFDSYPLTLTQLEASERYDDEKYIVA